jgi:flagellar biosynthesis GTPase FlhF
MDQSPAPGPAQEPQQKPANAKRVPRVQNRKKKPSVPNPSPQTDADDASHTKTVKPKANKPNYTPNKKVASNKSSSNRSNINKKLKQKSKAELRTEELQQLEYRLTKTSQFKLINTTNISKTYKIHISRDDQFRLVIPYDKSKLIELKPYVEDFNQISGPISNVLNNFNSKVRSSPAKSLLFLVNYLVNNFDNLRDDELSFEQQEALRSKLI